MQGMTGTTALTFWRATHNGMLSWGYDSNGSQQKGVTVGRRADCVRAAGFRHGEGRQPKQTWPSSGQVCMAA
jgi:hypothetical protein